MIRSKTLGAGILLLVGSLWGTSIAVAQEQCQPIRRLGGSSTAIVRGGVKDVGQMAKKLEDPKISRDLQQVLVEGLEVSPEVAAEIYAGILAEAQKQAAEKRAPTAMTGKETEYLWMAYRKGGKATLLKNCCWRGTGPLYAWELLVEHGDTRYHFILPKDCLNLAVHKESIIRITRIPDTPPVTVDSAVCKLQATADNQAGTVTLDTSGSKGEVTITVTRDGSPVASPNLTQTSPGKWLFRSPDNGSFTFSATATTRNESDTCSVATAKLVPPPISCTLTAAATADDRIEVQLNAPGLQHGCPEVRYTLDSGKSGSAELAPCDATSWVYPAKGRVKAGSYTFSAGVTGPRGSSATCDAALQVPLPPFPRWTLRGFGARLNNSSDDVRTEAVVGGVSERTKLHVGDGSGFGLGLEYRPSERIGVELGALFLGFDSSYVLDIGSTWAMSTDELDFSAFTLGLNLHPLDSGRRLDLFLGPFIGIGQYDDVEVNALGRRRELDFDDDFLWGLQVGADYSLRPGSPWALTGGLKYLDTTTEELESGAEFDLGGLLFGAGLAYRF